MYLLLYLCPHKFLSSTMLNVKKLYFFNLNITFFCPATYRDKIDRNFQHRKIDYILEATCNLLHRYHLCFMLLATSPVQFPSASATFSHPVHLFPIQPDTDYATMHHLFNYINCPSLSSFLRCVLHFFHPLLKNIHQLNKSIIWYNLTLCWTHPQTHPCHTP